MSAGTRTATWVEHCLQGMRAAVASLGERAPMLAEMVEYHLGWTDGLSESDQHRGKMIRPLVAIECCRAVSDDRDDLSAIPLAAAIELLHNFTLIHDDIQDNSPTRRHRPTVWATWGEAQAINAGDALFAAAHLALLAARAKTADPSSLLALIVEFERTTIEIVAGQVLDLQFEKRSDVTADEYITMISGKTARIVELAAEGGAMMAGASSQVVQAFSAFGRALGLGFQVQDDLLGAFGNAEVTGKAAADDIRRKKQSLPVILLRERASGADRADLGEIYAQPALDSGAVAAVLDLMDRYEVEAEVARTVTRYHDDAEEALRSTGLPDTSLEPLHALTDRLATRRF
jgi:geranylgeranyl diphosphate synthase, type I